MGVSEVKYKTKPLECWQKVKELRFNYYKEIATAREEGKLVVTGGADAPAALLAGLGNYVHLSGEPYGASVGTDSQFSQQCLEATEAQGFARDMCSYFRNYYGSMALDHYAFGGPFPRPDLCLQMHICDTHAKWWQVVSKHFGVPYFSIDYPVMGKGQRNAWRLEYLVGQMHDCIEWLEKVTGRKYDDEKLIQAVRNECLSSSLWGEIMLLNQNTPAPLDQKSIFSLYVPLVLFREKRESVEFHRLLLDEVKERLEQGVAALPTERCRLLDDFQPPWFFLKLYRYLEQYGAVVVGSWYSVFLFGNLHDEPDGSFSRALPPWERGMPMKTRDEALRALASWLLEMLVYDLHYIPQCKSNLALRMVKAWKADGCIIHLNRGCEIASMGSMESRLAQIQAGIPVVTYESNMTDKREFDETQVLDRLDAFMESLGLKKLEIS